MQKLLKYTVNTIFVLYLLIMFYLLFLTGKGYWSNMPFKEYVMYTTNLIPFKTILEYINAMINNTMNLDICIKNLLGNFLLFAPMGLFVPYYLNGYHKIKRYFILLSSIILSIEIIQLITRRGSFDIDDYILNIAGAIIGFYIIKFLVYKKHS